MDSSTKRTFLILGLIVLVLLVLFVVAAVAADSKGGSSGCTPERRKEKQTSWFPAKAVKPGELRGSCATKLGPFVTKGDCDIQITSSDERSRKLVMTLDSAPVSKIDVVFDNTADERTLTMKAKLELHKATEFSFGKDSQAIHVKCPASPSSEGCRITLQ